jgi:23S rRNA pseudouridine1911/1915/1917 synthase
MTVSSRHLVTAQDAGATLAALLRERLSNLSWSSVRRHITQRRVRLNGELCLDPARRVKEGDAVEVLAQSAPKPRHAQALTIRYKDAHLVVVEKPAGLSTVRHPSERGWPAQRKALTPTLEDLVKEVLADGTKGPPPRLRIVHRLDKETSGLLVFARSVIAERGLGQQFRAHSVVRRYLALVAGALSPQRIESQLVRDRGDGRRGSTKLPDVGKQAITHVEVVERLAGYTLVSCRLETGRTHQIRIHLAELGHPVCGERVYRRLLGGAEFPDKSRAPRLALHAAELGFQHPATLQDMHWTMPLPADLQRLLQSLRL